MDKKTFNNVAYMITKEITTNNNLAELCYLNKVTPSDFYEFVEELALVGFKEKYNQHNHKENNKNHIKENMANAMFSVETIDYTSSASEPYQMSIFDIIEEK